MQPQAVGAAEGADLREGIIEAGGRGAGIGDHSHAAPAFSPQPVQRQGQSVRPDHFPVIYR